MKPDETTTTGGGQSPPTEKYFTPDEANAALVLVRKIVTDIVTHYRQLLTLRDERHELANRPGHSGKIEQLTREIEQVAETLDDLHGELGEIGCVLKDWASGLVDFPAWHEDRQVWLCWRLGEPSVAHWHELNTGMAGRQPINPVSE